VLVARIEFDQRVKSGLPDLGLTAGFFSRFCVAEDPGILLRAMIIVIDGDGFDLGALELAHRRCGLRSRNVQTADGSQGNLHPKGRLLTKRFSHNAPAGSPLW
jgi:hypothetical protein